MQGRQAGREGGRAEWWQLRLGRTGSKETAPQTVSERFPAGQHSLPSTSLNHLQKVSISSSSFGLGCTSFVSVRESEIWKKHVMVRESPLFPQFKAHYSPVEK